MEQRIVQNIAAERGINYLPVLREYYEYLVLRDIYNSGIGDKIAFKGGTALRLFYGLPRYSDDLDFSVLREFPYADFTGAAGIIEKNYPVFRISDIWNKRNTYICEYKIKEDWQTEAFSLKIEISKRRGAAKKDTELRMAVSEEFGIQIFGRVFTAQAIYGDKIRALKGRDEPKDYFDMWYLSRLLKKDFKPGKAPDKKRYRQVLGKYLPAEYKKILGEIL